MAISDRAFRALARAEPNVIATLLRVVAPTSVPRNAVLTPDDVAASQLDPLPPPLDVDWVARADGDIIHVECQGYRDAGFVERLFWYHLHLVLRYRSRPLSARPVDRDMGDATLQDTARRGASAR